MANEHDEDLAFEQLFHGAPLKEERQKGQPKQRRPKARRKPGGGVRVLSFEASTAVHLAVLLLLLALPQAQPARAAKPEVIPIEVAFVPQPMAPQREVAPPGPQVKPVPEPLPAAPEKPAPKPQRQQAAAPKRLPPKPRVIPAKPAPKPQRQEVAKPKAPDLQALLNARMNAGDPSEEQRLAALRDRARTGADATKPEPASGLPMGHPKTSGSGLSGALASRSIALRVNPAYPDQAQRIGDEGQVVVRIWVTAAGAVSRTEVVRSSGRGYFDRSAVAAMKQWRFNPLPGAEGGEQFGDITLYFTL